MPKESPSLRERTRRAVQAEIVSVATELFARDGFEATTVDDIAAAASISRSSFFRYFATKEDVVLQLMVDAGEQVAAAIGKRPEDESPWVSLRRGFDELVGEMEGHPERAREATLLIRRSPALHAAHLQRCSDWSKLIEAQLAPRLLDGGPIGGEALRAAALVGAALACLEAANQAWTAAGRTRPFGALLDDAMSAVAPLRPS
jgi:AcrR family transcriptional regulator